MRVLWLLLIASIMIRADELDFLDEIDSDVGVFEEKKNTIDARVKLSFQKNEIEDDDRILYLRLGKQEKNYSYDVRLIADEDKQSLNIKELYYKGSFAETSFYEVGRINIKEGVARGYNPTDYFKGSYSLTLSSDPKERKENRLGALLFSETLFLDKFTVKGIYSPKVSVSKNNLLSDTKYIGLHLDESNYHDRASLYVDYSGFKDVSSSMIFHLNEDDLNFGFNLSYVYESWIMYLENSLKYAKNDINKMQVHPDIKKSFEKEKAYIDQATLGFNYTSESNIVTILEYIFNSGGLDSDDWDDWFRLSKNPFFAGELGGIRESLVKNETILSQQSLFLLSRASDIQTNLDASFLAWVNPYDGSSLSQVGFEYAYDDSLQTNLFVRNYQGKKDSEYGSALNDYEVLIEAEYFF